MTRRRDPRPASAAPVYLGDGVSVAVWQRDGLVLTVTQGAQPPRTIYFAPAVAAALREWLVAARPNDLAEATS